MKLDKTILKGSLVLLVAFNIFNLLNFVFHFSMVRLLTVADYGVLATLFTIIYIFGVFSESIQTIITKYSAQENEKGKLKNILMKSFRKAFSFSLLVFVVYLICAIFLSDLLKIEYYLMALNGVIIFGVFLAPITRGVLQGRKRFKGLGVNMVIEAVLKLGLAIGFVYTGWRVYGAILGTIIGMFAAILLSFFSLTDIVKTKEENARTEGIYGYGRPAFLIIFVILIFYSIDVIIAKIVFSAEVAGMYAIASILAKTIFFGTQPISKAMFPITAEGDVKGEKKDNVFMNALCILSGIILIALVLFYFFSDLIIRIFSGEVIRVSSGILFYLGIAISLISFSNIILLYKLSLGKVKNCEYLFIFVLVEIGLLWYFSANVFQFSVAFIVSSAIFLWGAVFLMND